MTTTLFTRTLLKGLSDGMADAGHMAPFANDDLAIGVFDKISADLGLPAILEAPLPNDTYIKMGQWLLDASASAVQQGMGPTASTQAMSKQAAHVPLETRAMKIAAFMMAKTAEEASLNGTGSNTPESAAATNAIAALDQKNRSSLQYLVGMGNTDMPEGGVQGRQMPHPMAPKGPAINNSLTHLDKQASEKVARAATFVQGLAQRGAEVTAKTVLASAALVEGGAPGNDVMLHILQNVKTAEELDGMLGGVMDAQQAHGAEPDPALVAAIEQVLMEHGLLDGGDEGGAGDEDPGMPEDGEGVDPDPKVAAMSSVVKSLKGGARSARSAVRGATNKAKGAISDVAAKAKDKAKDAGSAIAKATKKHGPAAAAGAAVGAVGGAAAMHAAHKAKDESAKEAELLSVLKAAADGSLNAVGENTPEDAAKDNANAELDMENRKPEEYLKGPGKTDLPNVGHVGASMDAPKGPEKLNPDTTPARETKSASFNEAVKTAAAQWGGKLPLTMPQTEKRAHILAIAGMPEDMREGYVQHLLGS
jgi:hypothetical protein